MSIVEQEKKAFCSNVICIQEQGISARNEEVKCMVALTRAKQTARRTQPQLTQRSAGRLVWGAGFSGSIQETVVQAGRWRNRSQEKLESRIGKWVAAGDSRTLTTNDGPFFSPPQRSYIEPVKHNFKVAMQIHSAVTQD